MQEFTRFQSSSSPKGSWIGQLSSSSKLELDNWSAWLASGEYLTKSGTPMKPDVIRSYRTYMAQVMVIQAEGLDPQDLDSKTRSNLNSAIGCWQAWQRSCQASQQG